MKRSCKSKKHLVFFFLFLIKNDICGKVITMNNLEVLESVKVNPALQNYILSDIPKEYNKFQQAIYVYAKLCSVLNYDSGFLASEHEGPLLKMHENPKYLETVDLQNTDIVCFEFNILCMNLLNKIGIKSGFYEGNDKKSYGTHSDIYFFVPEVQGKLPDDLQAGEKVAFKGYADVTNFKVDGKISLYPVDFRRKRDALPEYVAKIVETVKQQVDLERQQQRQEMFNREKVLELEKKYKQFADTNKVLLSDKEKIDIFLEQINKIDLGKLAALKYGVKLFKNIQQDLAEPNRAKYTIIREKQAEDLYKLIGIFSYNADENVFYLKIDPPHQMAELTQKQLQTSFDSGKYDYLSDYFSATAIIPKIQSKFIDDLLKDINFVNLFVVGALQVTNENSSSPFVEYYNFVKEREFESEQNNTIPTKEKYESFSQEKAEQQNSNQEELIR